MTSAISRHLKQFIVFVIDVIIVVDKLETGSTLAHRRLTGSTTGNGQEELWAAVEDGMLTWSVWRR